MTSFLGNIYYTYGGGRDAYNARLRASLGEITEGNTAYELARNRPAALQAAEAERDLRLFRESKAESERMEKEALLKNRPELDYDINREGSLSGKEYVDQNWRERTEASKRSARVRRATGEALGDSFDEEKPYGRMPLQEATEYYADQPGLVRANRNESTPRESWKEERVDPHSRYSIREQTRVLEPHGQRHGAIHRAAYDNNGNLQREVQSISDAHQLRVHGGKSLTMRERFRLMMKPPEEVKNKVIEDAMAERRVELNNQMGDVRQLFDYHSERKVKAVNEREAAEAEKHRVKAVKRAEEIVQEMTSLNTAQQKQIEESSVGSGKKPVRGERISDTLHPKGSAKDVRAAMRTRLAGDVPLNAFDVKDAKAALKDVEGLESSGGGRSGDTATTRILNLLKDGNMEKFVDSVLDHGKILKDLHEGLPADAKSGVIDALDRMKGEARRVGGVELHAGLVKTERLMRKKMGLLETSDTTKGVRPHKSLTDLLKGEEGFVDRFMKDTFVSEIHPGLPDEVKRGLLQKMKDLNTAARTSPRGDLSDDTFSRLQQRIKDVKSALAGRPVRKNVRFNDRQLDDRQPLQSRTPPSAQTGGGVSDDAVGTASLQGDGTGTNMMNDRSTLGLVTDASRQVEQGSLGDLLRQPSTGVTDAAALAAGGAGQSRLGRRSMRDIFKAINSILNPRKEMTGDKATEAYRENAIMDGAEQIANDTNHTAIANDRRVSTTANRLSGYDPSQDDPRATPATNRGGNVSLNHEQNQQIIKEFENPNTFQKALQRLRLIENTHLAAGRRLTEDWIAPSRSGIMNSLKRVAMPEARGTAAGLAGFGVAMGFPEFLGAIGINQQDLSRPMYDVTTGALSGAAAEAVTYKLATGAFNMSKIAEGGLAGGVGMLAGDMATNAIESNWKITNPTDEGQYEARDITSDVAGGAVGAVAGGVAAAGFVAAGGAIAGEGALAAVSAAMGPIGWMVAGGVGLAAIFGGIFGSSQARTDESSYIKAVKSVKAQANAQTKEYNYAVGTNVLTSQYQGIADELGQYGASPSLMAKIHTDYLKKTQNPNATGMTSAQYTQLFNSYLSQFGGNMNYSHNDLTGKEILQQSMENNYQQRQQQLTELKSALISKQSDLSGNITMPKNITNMSESDFVTAYNNMLGQASSATTSALHLTTMTLTPYTGVKYNLGGVVPPSPINQGDNDFYQDMIAGSELHHNNITKYNSAVQSIKKDIDLVGSQYYHQVDEKQFDDFYSHLINDTRTMYALSTLTDKQRQGIIRNAITNGDSIDGYTLTNTAGASSDPTNLNTAFTDDAGSQLQTDYQKGDNWGTFIVPDTISSGEAGNQGAVSGTPQTGVSLHYKSEGDGFGSYHGDESASETLSQFNVA